MSSSFSPVRLLQLEFRSPYSLVGCYEFLRRPAVSCLGCWLRLFFHLFFFLVCFLVFLLPFTSVFPDCPSFGFARWGVVTCGSPFFFSPFGSFTLASRLRCLPCGLFPLVKGFLLGCLSFASFLLRFFHLRVALVLPCWCVHIVFGCFSLAFSDRISRFSFPCIPRSRFCVFVFCFVPPGSVCRLVPCFVFLFVFSRLCAVLSLPVLSVLLSFFMQWFPAEFSRLCLLFSFTVPSLGRSLSFLRYVSFLSVLLGVYRKIILPIP